MGNARGVRRDFEALEQRRLAAVELFAEDLNNSEIGRRLYVCNQTVSRWRKEMATGGAAVLQAAGRAGRKPKLAETQKAELVKNLLAGPERLGYETPLWTCERVAHLIESKFDISYHRGHVWRVLRGLNWSPQRPGGKAVERNEEAIAEWKRKTWPEIKKKLVQKGARSFASTKAD